MRYDAIIIGSGLGGLSCGAYMARKGLNVLILEKHHVPGGYATCFKRGDFIFDASLHIVPGVGEGQHHYKWLEWCGVSDRIEFQRLKWFGRLIFPTHDLRLPGGDLQAVTSILSENFPHESRGIETLFKEMVNVHNDIIKFIFSPLPLYFQLPFFPFKYRALLSVLSKTGAQLLKKHIKDKRLKALLFPNWFFYGLPPSRLNSFFSVLPNMGFWVMGAYYPKGGAQAVSNAFVDVIKENGGEIVLGSEVVSIITEAGKAIGVVTADGNKFYGENVVSNACPINTFHKLVGRDKLPRRFAKKMDQMEPSISAFCVYLGLDDKFLPKLENREDYELFISDTYDQDMDYQWCLNAESDKASFVISLYSNVDCTLAKGSKFVLSLSQLQGYQRWQEHENDYNAGNKAKYREDKGRMAKVLIERAERIVPGISEHIESMEVATPLTFKRYTQNYNGAIYGWANTVSQGTPLNRMKQKTPIKNLYLSSAWTFPGEGQLGVMMSGCRLGRMLAGE
jgi:phytoene dehydrogenase-like protein